MRLGIVSPPSVTSSSGNGIGPSGSNGEVNPATIPGGVFTVIVSSTLPRFSGEGGENECNSTCRVEKYEAQVRRQILAGGLVGGFMVLFGAGFGIWLVWAWRSKVRRRREEENGRAGSDGFVMQDVGGAEGKTEMDGSEQGERGTGRGRALSLDDTSGV